MNRRQLEDNKARWALFEQVSTPKSAILWAIVALVAVIGAYYLYLLM